MYIIEVGSVKVQCEDLDTAKGLILSLAKGRVKGNKSQVYDRKMERNLVKGIKSPEEIPSLIGKVGHSIHTVYSGLNDHLRKLGYDPIVEINRLVEAGLVQIRPAKGGYMVML